MYDRLVFIYLSFKKKNKKCKQIFSIEYLYKQNLL